MRQDLLKILKKVSAGEASLGDLERWVVLNINNVAREDGPEVREAFRELDVLLLQRTVGEAEEGEIWQVILRWRDRLSMVGVVFSESLDVKTESGAKTSVYEWEVGSNVRTFRKELAIT